MHMLMCDGGITLYIYINICVCVCVSSVNNFVYITFRTGPVFRLTIYIYVLYTYIYIYIFRRLIYSPHLGLFNTGFVPSSSSGPRLGHFQMPGKMCLLIEAQISAGVDLVCGIKDTHKI